ncbi:DUF6115 domain-containing protein [Fervidobacterium nodosum]|uniref:Uncharacterized protein n=1 Tax=Fervidobacterium nodosum (strain ATCC 35602 / DSM 5306 / Rt17-B1) TaxID=381764 RepID=A7HNP1_FERNB|nr:hypothetical protein [Fervidobacterium nodosum]ABS61524.1 hypothetical protein Fnod_1689 [Fervidobacterium nodosum Rt17-B1]PHJ12807.1 hypothetical protein IM41_06900 [Fervidobacterium sp. SC_NGM5_G05]
MGILNWLVVFSAIGSLLLLWSLFIVQTFNKKHEKSAIDEEEERLIELMGRVRVFVDSKIEQLDRKMDEVRELIKALNDQYITFSAMSLEKIDKTEGQKIEFEDNSVTFNNEKTRSSVDSKKNIEILENLYENSFEEKYTSNNSENNDENNVEKRIYEMYLNGMEPIEIAKNLKMGVGEVQLIIDLMSRQQRG